MAKAPMSITDYAVFIILVTVALAFIGYKKFGEPKAGAATALDPTTYKKFKLTKKKEVNHNVTIFTFALDSPTQRLGLPVGQHIYLRFYEDGKPISRAYTPITSEDTLGHFDLLIKLYPQGKMSQYLKARKEGDMVDVRGPLGSLHYLGKGKFEIQRKTGKQVKQVKKVGMIAGGSGITPMLQIVRAVTKDKSDHTHKSLVFGNVSTKDILLRDELDAVTKENQNFNIHYVVDKKPEEEWKYSVGFVTPEIIDKYLPPPGDDILILLCGPKIMTDTMTKHLTEGLNYKEDMIFSY